MSAVLPQGATQAPHQLRQTNNAARSRTSATQDFPVESSVPPASVPQAYGDVESKISFLDPTIPRELGELYFWSTKPPEGSGQKQNTLEVEEQEVTLHDLRSLTDAQRREQGFVTDHAGFEVIEGFGDETVRQPWADEAWQSDDWIKSEYYKDVDALLKKRFGATSTFIFDHTLRKRDPNANENDPNQRQPVNRAHIDQSEWAALERVRIHLGEEMYQRAKANRGKNTGLNIKLVNVWRPLRDNIDNDWPLAVGDYRTFSDDKLVVAQLKYPDRTGETLTVLHDEREKFYYLSSHRADEATLLKCFDLKDDTKTPHTAFEHPGAKATSRPRWSIEVRTLVVTDPEAEP
ncbi:unnamed protein product [Sympodiomycopsis kandeliae]